MADETWIYLIPMLIPLIAFAIPLGFVFLPKLFGWLGNIIKTTKRKQKIKKATKLETDEYYY